MNRLVNKHLLLGHCFLVLALVPLSCLGQTFGDRLKNVLFGQTNHTQSKGEYIGGRRGYVEGAGSVNSMECYEMGGRDHQYPSGIREAQRHIARNPNDPFATHTLASLTRACGPLPQLYSQKEHQAWLKEKEAENAKFRAAYEGSAMQKRDQALLRLLEPVVEGDAPESHNCNQSEKQMYASAKEIVRGGYNAGYSKNDLDGAHLTIELIENRCGIPKH